MDSDFNSSKTIFTARTKLRRYVDSDRKIFAELFTDPDVNHFMGGEHCETKEDAYDLFDKSQQIYEGLFPGRHFQIWAIEYEGKLIGHFELKQTPNTGDDELEVVYLLDKDHWGRGLMPEVLNKINEYSSENGKQLIATVNPENIKTTKALKKSGVEKEAWIEDNEGKVYKVWIKRF